MTGKGNATDEPMGLPLLGGIGTGAFGRDLDGHFNHWQLQPGFSRLTSVDAASLAVTWSQGERKGGFRVGDGGWDRPLPKGARRVAAVWPIVSEYIAAPDWPVEIVLESWSPVVSHDDGASALPVAFFDVYVHNPTAQPASIDLGLFMPNFLGWRKGYGTVAATPAPARAPRETSRRLGSRVWPERSNSGNYPVGAEPDLAHSLLTGVLFQRSGYSAPGQDMEGEVLLGVSGAPGVRAQRNVCSFATAREGQGSEAVELLDRVERDFFESGHLPAQEKGWRSEANEVLASAVSGGVTLAPGEEQHFTLLMVWDLPLVEFGSGRTWEKAYTKTYGADGKQSRRIALDALAKRAEWRQQIDRWQSTTIGDGAPAARKRRAAALNDLSYLISGGTAWVAQEHPRAGLEPPLLGSGEHFSILEGCDNGYYFCTTFDLWPHAQPAFEANWPHLAELVLNDYLKTVPMTIADPRFITGTNNFTIRKVANKIPHDLGCPAGDPWNLLNEYGSTRDSNVWKDHDPEFILSLYLHRKASGGPPPSAAEWAILAGMADFMISQDTHHDGLPYHDTQGDSTWDALHFTGPSPYSGALTLGAWAALVDWAKQRGDTAREKLYADRLAQGQASFEKYFWNGSYYRSAANGDQAEWILCDALFGILVAESAGLHGLLPAGHVTAHLRKVAVRNWRDFGEGRLGPSLLVPPAGPIPTGRTQVGEVLVGSARACIALMQRFDLREEGDAMADAVNRTLYETSDLQFRTPAAWTTEQTFRAPSNLRPLSSWYSLWPDRL